MNREDAKAARLAKALRENLARRKAQARARSDPLENGVSMTDKNATLERILHAGPVIPVVTIHNVAEAVPLARALLAGGVSTIEITLRTPVAIDAIQRVADEVPGMSVGAGTILDTDQAEAAHRAGAAFLVSPGFTETLSRAAAELPIPWLAGVATAGEAMRAREAGLTRLKFFPAEQAGGAAMLGALAAPLAGIVFCPTGGIDRDKATAYLSLPNVACVGGSFLTPAAAIREGRFDEITRLAREASTLRV